MGRVVRCAAVLAVSCVAIPASLAVAGAAEPVLTESARSVLAGQIAQGEAAGLSPAAARSDRVRSRVAFRGLPPREAREALVERHPLVVSRPGWLTFPSLSPVAAGRPVGPNVLRVDGGGSADSLVVTSKPVAFRDEAGDLRRIDLALERAGGELVARESPIELSLPDSLDEGISVGSGDRRFSIIPEVSNAAADAVIEQYSAFYGAVSPDTDFVVKPVVGGVETFSVLRSPAGPEQLRFRIAGGADTDLRPTDPAGGFVLSRGEEDLAFVSAPLAWDAQQRPVPVEASVDGDDLILQVPHRDRDVAYPIVVDPTVLDTCWLFIAMMSGCHVDLWETSTDPKFTAGTPGWAFYGDSRFAGYAGPGYLGSGLYIRNLVNNFYNSSEAGYWFYRAPLGVRIYGALFANLTQDNTPNNMSCLFVGVLSGTGNWEPNAPRTFCAQQTYDAAWHWSPIGNPYYRGGGTEGNIAIFGAMAQGTGWNSYWMDHMGGVAIGLQEMNYPSLIPYISSPDFPDDWQTDPNRSITFHAGDAGLGIRSITFSSPENPTWQPIDADTGTSANKVYDWCTGGARLACPKDIWLKLKIGNLPAGYSTIRATVTDIVGKTHTYEHPIAVQYYWASLQYGGEDERINVPAEIEAFLSARNPADSEATIRLWLGAAPEDQEHIAAYIENDAWNPPGIDEDDLTVDSSGPTTDDPAVTRPAETQTSTYSDAVQGPDGHVVVKSTEDVDTQAVMGTVQTCPTNYVNRNNHKVFRMTRKASLRVFLLPSVRYHVQINAKPQDIPWVESSVVTTIFTHPDRGIRIKNRVFRPSPGKPAYYAHSNSHARPGVRFHYDSLVRFTGDGIITRVYPLPNRMLAIRYLKATGHEGTCLA